MLLPPSCVLCGGLGQVVCAPCAGSLSVAPQLPHPLGLDSLTALYDYSGARALVTALKNGDRRDLVPWLVEGMARAGPGPLAAVVTWAPTGTPRRRARGYDQAELLARALARRWRAPCRALLQRAPGPAQSGLTAAERHRNPVFAAVGRVPTAVVVVDDVATTGATLSAAARALRRAGATRVEGVVAARAAASRAA